MALRNRAEGFNVQLSCCRAPLWRCRLLSCRVVLVDVVEKARESTMAEVELQEGWSGAGLQNADEAVNF